MKILKIQLYLIIKKNLSSFKNHPKSLKKRRAEDDHQHLPLKNYLVSVEAESFFAVLARINAPTVFKRDVRRKDETALMLAAIFRFLYHKSPPLQDFFKTNSRMS